MTGTQGLTSLGLQATVAGELVDGHRRVVREHAGLKRKAMLWTVHSYAAAITGDVASLIRTG